MTFPLDIVAASCGKWGPSRCAGLSLSRPLLLRSTGSRRAGSAVVAHGPSCSVACGIFPDQGSNPCPLHWQADSQPLRHQGSPWLIVLNQLSFALKYFMSVHFDPPIRRKALWMQDYVLCYFCKPHGHQHSAKLTTQSLTNYRENRGWKVPVTKTGSGFQQHRCSQISRPVLKSAGTRREQREGSGTWNI